MRVKSKIRDLRLNHTLCLNGTELGILKKNGEVKGALFSCIFAANRKAHSNPNINYRSVLKMMNQ